METSTLLNQLQRLEEENRRLKSAIEELSILNDIAIAISSTYTLDKIVELIVQKCVKHLKVEQGAVMLLKAEDQISPFKTMVRQADTSRKMLPYRLNTQLAGWMLKNKSPLLINDLNKDERFYKIQGGGFPIHSLLCVPLLLKGKMIGLLAVFNKHTENGFSEDDRRLLSIIAAQSAQVIENARLLEEEQAYIRIQEEMRLARESQMNLLPKNLPEIPGYEIFGMSIPAKEVGGDYFDFIPVDDHRLAFCLGDVTGKGIAAALLMANLQALVRSQTGAHLPAEEIINRCNTLLFHSTDLDKFATLFYGILDFKRHQMTYCNAGHDHPILFSKKEKIRYLSAGGTVLGFLENYEFTEDVLPLNPGDFLLIYSDGISEAFNTSGEEFGQARIAEIILHNMSAPLETLSDHIIRAIRFHTDNATQTDDITLVLLRRKQN